MTPNKNNGKSLERSIFNIIRGNSLLWGNFHSITTSLKHFTSMLIYYVKCKSITYQFWFNHLTELKLTFNFVDIFEENLFRTFTVYLR